MNIQRNNLNPQYLSFKGHKKTLDKTGYEQHNFFYLYDPNKYKCEVELYNIDKNEKTGDYSIADKKAPAAVIPMNDGGVRVDMFDIPEVYSSEGFAYRFKLTDKLSNEVSYAFDNGSVIGIFDKDDKNSKYNVILNNRATINKNGPMQLIMPDEYYPGVENVGGKPTVNEALRAKALKSVRNHANKLGGNLYGIIERLPELQKEGISRIVGTPFTKDTISSHLYWTENAYQVAPTLGTEQDFKDLQRELFKNGINWIADAALVNEGFGGIHLSELLRKGSDSESKYMFRSGERLALGILPDKENDQNTRMKIINAPFSLSEAGVYEKVNPDYNPAKPTYIQFYDVRLASEEQVKSDSPSRMTTYDNKNTDNIYDITRHDDAVYPFPIEVSPYELERNIKELYSEDGIVDLTNVETIKRVANFTNFSVVNKSAAGGLEVWDGNVDIAKLNFYGSDSDNEKFVRLPEDEKARAMAEFNRGTLAVRDYAVNSGKYWTKLTADTQLAYLANLLSSKNADTPEEYMSAIKEGVKNGEIPKSALSVVDIEVVENVLNDNYNLRRLTEMDMRSDLNPELDYSDYKLSDYVLKQSMDMPLETLPFAINLLGIVTSPYIAKKANVKEELGVSRYDVLKAGDVNLPEKYQHVYSQMNDVYENAIVPKIMNILNDIPGLNEDGNVSEYGKYVISEIAPDLTKYLFVKALAPQAEIKVMDDGHLDFTNVNAEDITMQSLGIPFDSKTSEEEAQIVVNMLKKGLDNISETDYSEIKQKVTQHFTKNSVNDYKIAEMIIDRTESGLGWRIDAAKDIAAIDSVRSDSDGITYAWNNVIDFWKLYNQSVLQINPHAYTTAEITDLNGLFSSELDFVINSPGLATDNDPKTGLTDKELKAIQNQVSARQFRGDADAERKFLEETGITAVANYNYFFSLLPEMFSLNSIEHGGSSWMSQQEMNHELRNKLDSGWMLREDLNIPNNPGFLFQSSDDGVTNSYTFIGNHDKPRVLHGLALDMGLFNSDFSDVNHKNIAAKVLQQNVNDINFDKVNPMAIAMGARLNEAFSNVVKNPLEKEAISQAISQLASGSFKDKDFDATAFGTRPFEIAISSVLEQYEHINGVPLENKEDVEARVLEDILTPAFDRFYSMYKLLTVLPGSPTDFAGDRVASTGYETKAKNYHQQNRNVIHWEWLSEGSDNKYKFVKTFYNRMNDIANLRSNPKLSALNDGATVTLPIAEQHKDDKGNASIQTSTKLQAMLRYNDKGSVVLTLHDLSGANTPSNKKMKRSTTSTDITNGSIYNRVVLCAENANVKQGLKHGLAVGTTFRNERSGDNSVYKIAKMTHKGTEYYYLKREDSQGKELPITIKPEDLNTLILYKQ